MKTDLVIQTVMKGIEDGVFPGAVIHIEREDECVFFEAFGDSQIAPIKKPMNNYDVFDLASLTKVIATLPAVLLSVQNHRLDLNQPIGYYLTEWNTRIDQEFRSKITVAHLLTHTSGLPAWKPYYIKAHSAKEYLEYICNEPLEYIPGSKVVYSDLGYMLLGFILEKTWQMPLVKLCAAKIFEPLEMNDTTFGPDLNHNNFVSTERGNHYELQMCRDYLQKCESGELPTDGFSITSNDLEQLKWRTDPACGEVNDGNSYYGLSGVSGHAGLFSTAPDVARYLSMWSNGGIYKGHRFLDGELVSASVVNHTKSLNIARGYGFEVVPQPDSAQWIYGCSAGKSASLGGFGHTGFTGTSFWYDPYSKTEIVALTNRTHPEVRDGISTWRHTLYQSAFMV